MNEILKKRLQSFIWRLAGVIVVVVLNETSKELTSLGVSGPLVVILGLITGEVTKFLNK